VGRTLEWGSTASGGIYQAHVLILQLILQALESSGWSDEMSWVGSSWILFFGTLAGASLLVGLLLRTPLRTIVTGPNRARQRDELRPDYGGLAPVAVDVFPRPLAVAAS